MSEFDDKVRELNEYDDLGKEPDFQKSGKDNDDDEEEEQDNKIEKIVNMIENRCTEIFADQLNETYVLIQINGHFEALSHR